MTAITRTLDPLPFDRLYGAFGRHVMQDAKATIARSRERYIAAIRGADAEAGGSVGPPRGGR